MIAAAIARVEGLVDLLPDEVAPATSNRLLENFERVLGPAPCDMGASADSIGQRQREAARRWTFKGGASKAWVVELAGIWLVHERLVTRRAEYDVVAVHDEELVV